MVKQLFGGNGPFGDIAITESIGGPYIKLTGFLIENPEQSALGVQNFGGFSDHYIEYFLETDTVVNRPQNIPEDPEVVLEFGRRKHEHLASVLNAASSGESE
jgi:hypothetical protein